MEEITKGWAEFNPIFVAVEAEDHKIDKANPAKKNFQLPSECKRKLVEPLYIFDNLFFILIY